MKLNGHPTVDYRPRWTERDPDVNGRLFAGDRRRFLTRARTLLGSDWLGTNLEHDTAKALEAAERRGKKIARRVA